ncbi:MAG: 4Fe-4S ferredoxin [Actinobacteria bacterium]|nr:4Fe-4S ferredoxin [Actinomycetota bacterium]
MTKDANDKREGMQLCSGCGVCAAVCPRQNLAMRQSDYGMPVPYRLSEDCPKGCSLCRSVCPFVSETSVEELAEEQYGACSRGGHRSEIGFYDQGYLGYAESETVRKAVASGGLATATLQGLLSRGEVDHVIAVRPTGQAAPSTLFEAARISTPEILTECAGSCYYPVSFDAILQQIAADDDTYAMIALPCVCQAIRLAQKKIPRLANIRYLLSITCGTLKSTCFTDYIAATVGVDPKKVVRICYRDKSQGLPVMQFPTKLAFRDKASGDIRYKHTTWLHGRIAAAFNTRLFSPLACNFCDDVFGECADATFMDAWLDDNAQQPLGKSIALFRNPELRECFENFAGIHVEKLSIDRVIDSQAGALDAKRIGLAVRYHDASHRVGVIPSVREHVLPPFCRIPLLRCWRYRVQYHMSRVSFSRWHESRGCPKIFWKLLWVPWQTNRVLSRLMRIFPKWLYQLRKLREGRL